MEKKTWLTGWFSELLLEGDQTWLTEHAQEPFIFHLPGSQTCSLRHHEYMQYLSVWHQRFKNVQFSIKRVIEQKSTVTIIYHCRATYHGGWLKITGKNQPVFMSGIMIFDLNEEGKICECWLEDSTFQLYYQLKELK